ncbi:hypothetical protein [Vibrio breoganii]|uniref:hypothetical protein n=1 Tax=Vibrio breoganii TaxID=553239 RepID=UPI000C82C244|nr:hypothetical protein [Vibrio breoganii]PML85242.1 hypothetical protein BCT68_07880 [Vibrio breoganii]
MLKFRIENYISLTIFVFYFLGSLQAFNIFGMPIPWLSLSLGFGLIVLGFVLKYIQISLLDISLSLIAIFILLLGNLYFSINVQGSFNIPSRMTTPYPIFLILRYYELIISLFLFMWLKGIYNHYDSSLADLLETRFIRLAAVISVLAIILLFIEQILGLPIIPRNRVGTGGGQQLLTFTGYGYRALGTFREPSHLALWLGIPFFLSLKGEKYRSALLIGATIILTGSLSSIVAMIFGFSLGAARNIGFYVFLVKRYFPYFILIFVVSILVTLGSEESILHIVYERLTNIGSEGQTIGNRTYILDYILDNDSLLILGSGLGNSNILLSNYFQNVNVMSFLSVFVNAYYSGGVLLLLLLSVVFLRAFISVSNSPWMLGLFAYVTLYCFTTIEVFSVYVAMMLSICFGTSKRFS